MEFSDLGKHCELEGCGQKDFLPFKCEGCSKHYCLDHRTQQNHKCSTPVTKDKRVNTCPLCDKPIGILPGEDINAIMDKHIQEGCKDPQRERVYKNRCSVKGCKKHELVPITCKQCNEQFCLKHRSALDHKCTPSKPEYATVGPFRIPIRVR